jgi:pimeloyl-ACP methyl ester carboxylesterase
MSWFRDTRGALRVAMAIAVAATWIGNAEARAARGVASEPLSFTDCQVGRAKIPARCATFRVPEDRANPAGRWLSLKVIVLPSTTPNPTEPVFLLVGGPGQAATDASGDPSLAWMHDGHDLVLMDFRGTKGDSRLDCPFASGDMQAFVTPLFGEDPAFWEACAKRLSATAELRLYTTPAALQDMDDLRQRLGANQIDIVGASYGTRAAIAYTHAFPSRVHAELLTGVLPLSNRTPLNHAAAAQHALDLTVAECERDTACHAAFPDPAGDLRSVLATLRATPAKVTLHDPKSGAETMLTLDAASFAEGVRVRLYEMESARRLPLLLKNARAGDYTPFAQSALDSGRGGRSFVPLGMLLSFTCSEDVARIDPKEIAPATAGSFIGDQRVRGQMAACSTWPTARLSPSYFQRFSSQVPVLLVSGLHDPVTPPASGEEARKTFPLAVHVITNGAHADITPCVEGLAAKLFRSGTLEGREAHCPQEAGLPPFALH